MLFSRRNLIQIIWPLIVQQTLNVTIGMIDSMMVSSAGEAAVSGVSLVGSLDILLIYAFSSLVTGGSIVVSQFFGKKDMVLVRNSAKQLLYVATSVATFVTIVVLTFRVPLLSLLFGSVEADVMSSALDYFSYIALSFPFLALSSAGTALYQCMGNSMVSMLISIFMNILNVGGNALLIFGFDMGAAGAAIATLFSRIVDAILTITLLHNKKNLIYIEKLFHYKPDFTIIKRILRLGVPNGIENSMFQFGKLLTQSLISSMGTVAIAANAVANSLATFQYMPGGAIGLATTTVVGRCIGAKEKEQAKKYSRILLATTYACLLCVVILTLLFSKPIIGLYGLSSASAKLANKLIIYHAVVAAFLWPIAFSLPSSFKAASDVKYTLGVSMISMWLFRVALGYVFATKSISLFGLNIPGLGLGVFGVWLAMTVDWLFRAILFIIRYLNGRWLTKYKD
jgi:putative MATE family efflux protein